VTKQTGALENKLMLTNLQLCATRQLSSKLAEKFLSQINMWDRNKIGYNFVFLFASPPYVAPLAKVTKYGFKTPYPLLSYQEEYRRIRESVKKAKIEITVQKIHATKDTIGRVFRNDKPGAIHFSGHGITNEEYCDVLEKKKAELNLDDEFIAE